MESGGQPGNQNAVKAKRWQKALERALARSSNKDVDAGLDTIADQVVKDAQSGNKDAWKEVADRMDGKVAQDVTLAGDKDRPVIAEIRHIIVDPKNGH